MARYIYGWICWLLQILKIKAMITYVYPYSGIVPACDYSFSYMHTYSFVATYNLHHYQSLQKLLLIFLVHCHLVCRHNLLWCSASRQELSNNTHSELKLIHLNNAHLYINTIITIKVDKVQACQHAVTDTL